MGSVQVLEVHTFGQKGWRSVFDAASQGLQETSHRSPSLKYTVCCPINGTLRAVGSSLHIQWFYCIHGMAHVFYCCPFARVHCQCMTRKPLAGMFIKPVVAATDLCSSCACQSIVAARQASYEDNRACEASPYSRVYHPTPGGRDALLCNFERS